MQQAKIWLYICPGDEHRGKERQNQLEDSLNKWIQRLVNANVHQSDSFWESIWECFQKKF